MNATQERKAQQDAAAAELREIGAECLKAEDRHGETKTGWWMDGVWLGPTNDPRYCLNVLRGN